VADGKVYLGTEKGDLWVLAAGKECKVLSRIRMGCPVYATPIVADGVLYIASQKRLYAVQAGCP
jgi:outer membrane protein assembly factor BamB